MTNVRQGRPCMNLLVNFVVLTPCFSFSPVQHRCYTHGTKYKESSNPTFSQPNVYNVQLRLLKLRKRTRLDMALIPLSVPELENLIANGAPTASQYASYWGRTSTEQYSRALESAIVSFLGVFFSYFLSFVLGGFIATIFGFLFFFWGVLSPQLKASQRNWEFLGGRELVDPWMFGDTEYREDVGLYGSLLLASIADVCVVESSASTREEEFVIEDFADYSMDTDEQEKLTGNPFLLRVLAADSSGRELQVHARLSEEYLALRPGMPLVAVLLSTSPTFDRLAAITDLFVPQENCWIGDYPYLNRAQVEELLARDDDIWTTLENEGFVDNSVASVAERKQTPNLIPVDWDGSSPDR